MDSDGDLFIYVSSVFGQRPVHFQSVRSLSLEGKNTDSLFICVFYIQIPVLAFHIRLSIFELKQERWCVYQTDTVHTLIVHEILTSRGHWHLFSYTAIACLFQVQQLVLILIPIAEISFCPGTRSLFPYRHITSTSQATLTPKTRTKSRHPTPSTKHHFHRSWFTAVDRPYLHPQLPC